MSLAIVFANERLVAFDKPAGLLSVPGNGPENQDCLAARAREHFPDALIVHRLDRETSGVIVLALNPDTHRALGMQFERRQTEKTYIAVAAGAYEHDEGEIDLPMRPDIDNRPRSIIDPVQGRAALTRWRVLERSPTFDGSPPTTRLELSPHTGRTHQLRLHLSAIGRPILGDSLYAPPEVRAMSPRLMLHAQTLIVTDPGSGERLRLHAPCPF